jgi:hypothetical protein
MAIQVKTHILDAVVGAAAEHDILPILLTHIKNDYLAFFLETLTLVCKMWHRVCRAIDSPDSLLRRALAEGHNHLASDLQIDCLWINDSLHRNILLIGSERIVYSDTYHQSETARIIGSALLYKHISGALKEYGGWEGRERRRRNGYHLQEGTKTYSPPPSAIMKGNTRSRSGLGGSSHEARVRPMDSYSMTKKQFDKLLEWDKRYYLCPAMDEAHTVLWNELWTAAKIDHPLSWQDGLVVLSGASLEGIPVTTFYIEVHCYDYTSIGCQLVRLPHLLARRTHVRMRAACEHLTGPNSIVWPCSEGNRAISPTKSGWETLCS